MIAFLLAALLTVKEAKDIHCRLTCIDEGEYSGEWSEKENACLCQYIRYPSLPINSVIKKEKPKEPID